MKHLTMLVLTIFVMLFTKLALADQVREIAQVRVTVASLPGVVDEGHLDNLAKGIVTASAEATCTLDWAEADWCRRSWSGSRQELQAALITVGYWESRFLARIGLGRCEKWECDAYKYKGVVYHRARGYFQVQMNGAVSSQEWRDMVGSSEWSAYQASAVAARLLARNRQWCKTTFGMFSGYARGGSCKWPGAGRRSLFLSKIVMPRLQTPVEPPAETPSKLAQSEFDEQAD